MIEQFHELDKCKLRTIAVHVVHLSAKSLPKGMATEIAYM